MSYYRRMAGELKHTMGRSHQSSTIHGCGHHPPVGKLLVAMCCTKCEEQVTAEDHAAGASSVQLVSVNLQAETMCGSDLVCGSGESLEGHGEGDGGFAAVEWISLLQEL